MAVMMVMHHYDDPDEDFYLAVLGDDGITTVNDTFVGCGERMCECGRYCGEIDVSVTWSYATGTGPWWVSECNDAGLINDVAGPFETREQADAYFALVYNRKEHSMFTLRVLG